MPGKAKDPTQDWWPVACTRCLKKGDRDKKVLLENYEIYLKTASIIS
jgi:hypothetical protein